MRIRCFLRSFNSRMLFNTLLRVFAFACLSLPLAYAASPQTIYGIKSGGDLLYYQYLGMNDGSFSWGKANVPAGNEWSFRHVFSGGDGVIFAITDSGDLYYYKYLGVNNGAKAYSKTHVLIGTGWNFRHVFSGGNGVIFAINDAGDLFYYKYLGMATGAAGTGAWGKTGGSDRKRMEPPPCIFRWRWGYFCHH